MEEIVKKISIKMGSAMSMKFLDVQILLHVTTIQMQLKKMDLVHMIAMDAMILSLAIMM